jgi:hypothetical protein
MIISISGLIGSGKDTVAKYLQYNYNYKSVSFAASLKDAVSAVFGWDRDLIEGQTAESRHWRECVDQWWAQRLGIPHLSPRWILQYWGTEVCRQGFHDDIWIASLENKLRKSADNIVISDARFPNELSTIRKLGGISLRITRGNEPDWYLKAVQANLGDIDAKEQLQKTIHPSEWSWIGYDFDYTIDNNSTVESLYKKVDLMIKNRL